MEDYDFLTYHAEGAIFDQRRCAILHSRSVHLPPRLQAGNQQGGEM